MKLIVDRIVEGKAVLEKEDLSFTELELTLLPEGTKEGSVIIFDGGVYLLDTAQEESRRQEILSKQKRVFKRRENN